MPITLSTCRSPSIRSFPRHAVAAVQRPRHRGWRMWLTSVLLSAPETPVTHTNPEREGRAHVLQVVLPRADHADSSPVALAPLGGQRDRKVDPKVAAGQARPRFLRRGKAQIRP